MDTEIGRVSQPVETIPWMSGTTVTPTLPPGGFPTPSSNSTQRGNTTVTSYITSTATPTITFTSDIISTTTTVAYSTIPAPNPAATAAIASASAVLANNAAMTGTKFIILVAIGGSTILLILILALISLIYIRRRRKSLSRGGDTDSPPFTSLAPRPPPLFAPLTTTQSAPQIPQQAYPTSLSMGPSRNYSSQALAANIPPTPPPLARPPTRPRRSISAPILAPEHERRVVMPEKAPSVPQISTQPNTPSVVSRDQDSLLPEPSPISPILQPGVGRTPIFREALQENSEEESARAGNGRRKRRGEERGGLNDGKLGLPGGGGLDQRVSAGASVTSEMMFMQGMLGDPRDRGNGSRDEGGQISTRASSGIFPEP